MRAIAVQLRTECSACGSPLPLNAMVPRLACPACSAVNDLGGDFWKDVLGDRELHSCSIIMQARELSLEVGFLDAPACAACGAEIPIDAALAAAGAGGVACPGCGVRALVRVPPHEWVISGFPLLVGEDPLQLPAAGATVKPANAARPVAFNCPTCGGVLQVDGAARVVQCSYCKGSAYLPDDLWHVFHPVAVTRPWYLLQEPQVRKAHRRVAENAATEPERLEELSHHLDEEVRQSVARNPRTPEATLRRLAMADDSLAGDALENPALPRTLWPELAAAGRPWILRRIGRGADAPPDALRTVAEQVAARLSGDWTGDEDAFDDSDVGDVLEALAQNPACPPEVLAQVATLVRQSGTGDYDEALARNPGTPATLLAELAGSGDDSVREAVAGHPHTAPQVLERLASDAESSVREAAARRTDLAPETLKRLGKDAEYAVREAARANSAYPRFSLFKMLFGG